MLSRPGPRSHDGSGDSHERTEVWRRTSRLARISVARRRVHDDPPVRAAVLLPHVEILAALLDQRVVGAAERHRDPAELVRQVAGMIDPLRFHRETHNPARGRPLSRGLQTPRSLEGPPPLYRLA